MPVTTLILPESLRRRLRDLADREGTSMAELLRRGADRLVHESALRGGRAGRRREAGARLPRSVEDYLAAPAGSFAGRVAPGGRRGEPEDAYADAD